MRCYKSLRICCTLSIAFSRNWAAGIIESMVPAVEVYSIDESFADLTGIPDISATGRRLCANILKCTGIPVGVGIAHTKTLSKLANHTAKRLQAHTGGVVNL